ncbi:cytochrome P450 [Lophiotrema nucula]|uniref:Cytochrome P450 n=1 Tax=Lophiotrema nucula TaxID=690887 RepID=A0A6A5ZGC8_9PLEO|nr:cytochrome P450 [Lophiotrema nucula]
MSRLEDIAPSLSDIPESFAPALRYLGTAIALWTAWYFYTFHLPQIRHSDEPPILPYRIPVVGHAFQMFSSASKLFARGKKQFKGRMFTIVTMGTPMYIVTSAPDVLSAFKMPKDLDFDPVIAQIMGCYGMSREGVEAQSKVGEGGKTFVDRSVEMFKVQLHPGEKLDVLQDVLLKRIDEQLTYEKIEGGMVREDRGEGKVVDMYEWAGTVIIEAQTRAFFDEVIFELCPEIVGQEMIFEEEAWKLSMELPRWAAGKFHSSMDYVRDGLLRYLQLPKEKRKGESWVVTSMLESMEKEGYDANTRAISLFAFYRVVNGNAYKLVFWLITYILFDTSSLLKDLQSEISPAFEPDGSINLDTLFNSCPLLASTCEEALRLTDWSVGMRKVTKDTVLAGKRLRAGRNLFMAYRTMHFDQQAFGTDADSFKPRRFMDNPSLIKSSWYKPFGGATHYCPGRFIARKEIVMFVAILLKRFDLGLPEGSKFPKVDDTLPSGGVQSPLPGQSLHVRVKKA